MLSQNSAHYPAVANLIESAARLDKIAFGLAIKVRGNQVLNWIYVDVAELKSVVALRGNIVFPQADDPAFNRTLRGLILSLSERTPFLALLIRYEEKSSAIKSWEFVDLNFLKNLTA